MKTLTSSDAEGENLLGGGQAVRKGSEGVVACREGNNL